MTSLDDISHALDDVDAILVDVLGSVLGDEATSSVQGLQDGPVATARLAIHDEVDDAYTLVEVAVPMALARVLASRMMFVADPAPDDVLDAVAELSNICGGNVKSLLCQHARLSLPVASLAPSLPAGGLGGVRVRAMVLGHVAELSVTANGSVDGLDWPPAALDDELEKQA